MAHAGTIDLGRRQQAKPAFGGSRLPVVILIVAIAVATVAAVWFATSAGNGTLGAKPAVDRSYDQIEAQRGAAVQTSSGTTYEQFLSQHDIAGLTTEASAAATYEQFLAQHDIAGLSFQPSTGASYEQFLAQHDIARLPFQMTSGVRPMTSGTFHVNSAADPAVSTPVTRDRVGGP